MREYVIHDDEVIASTITVGRDIGRTLVNVVAGTGPASRVAVICQPNSVALADSLASTIATSDMIVSGLTLPDGEAAKQLGVVEDIYSFLNDKGFTRADVAVAVGGGALSDVVGFAAATYLRGIPAIYVTTTVVGAVDAAIGGKTAVNVGGKNLAGVFRHPRHVLVDIDILDGLPNRLKAEGAAEALKTGFIADLAIVEEYERNGIEADLELVVNRSIAVKVDVVNDDFRESGRRAILNYGHTVGHAIEATTGRSHGESVSIGMVAEGRASAHALGFTGEERQKAVLGRVGLPIDAQDAKDQTVRAQMALDKKRDVSGLRMVMLRDFERPEVATVDDATVRAALGSVGIT